MMEFNTKLFYILILFNYITFVITIIIIILVCNFICIYKCLENIYRYEKKKKKLTKSQFI